MPVGIEERIMMPFSDLVKPARAFSAMLALFCVAATPATLPYQVAGDVAQSYQLLTTTYYDPVDPQALLAAAGDALAQAAVSTASP